MSRQGSEGALRVCQVTLLGEHPMQKHRSLAEHRERAHNAWSPERERVGRLSPASA